MQKISLGDGPVASEPVQIGRWRVDPKSDEIEADGNIVKLEPLKMRLLMALAAKPGQVVLTQELLDTVWSGVVVTPASVYQGIAQLRRVLGPLAGEDGQSYIDTVPRKGYRLVAPVQPWVEPVTAPAPGFSPISMAGHPTTAASAEPGLPRTTTAEVAPRLGAGPDHPFPGTLPASASPPPLQPVAAAEGRLRRRRWLIGATALAGLGGVAWRYRASMPPPTPVRIAVLPFDDRSVGASEKALAQGLALDVVRALEGRADVEVVAPDSSLAAATRADPIGLLGRSLRAGFVLIGELLRVGTRLRLAVRLLDWPAQDIRWQAEFEQGMDQVSTLPWRIAREATAALNLPALPSEIPRSANASSEAYELYVLGDDAWRAKTPEAFLKARDYFRRGIDADPGFARNYVGLGWTWIGSANYGNSMEQQAAFARAAPLFDKALRLDPASAEALTAQGVLASQARRFDAARHLFDRAVKLNPGYAQARHSYGVCEFDDAWPARAIPHFERAAVLNPLSMAPRERLGLSRLAAGQREQARTAYREAIALEPRHPNGHWGLGIAGYAEGELDVAVKHYREALGLEPRRPYLWVELGWLLLDLGLSRAAREAFDRATGLLPESGWMRGQYAFAWLQEPRDGGPPPGLALQALPEGEVGLDLMLVRAMAGLPLDAALLQQRLDDTVALEGSLTPIFWNVFLGGHPMLDAAAVFSALNQPERMRPLLDQAEQHLGRYQRQGNVWHALHFHLARLAALRGDGEKALKELGTAVDLGCRRGWWLSMDPAFVAVRQQPRFQAALTRITTETARQRARSNLS